MADLKTTQERRDRFRTWLHDDTRDHLSIRAWCVAEDACHDVDTLLAENAELRAEVERLRTSLALAQSVLRALADCDAAINAGGVPPLSRAEVAAAARAALGEP